MALTLWREASNQTRDAQTGVAQSIMNRVAHPGWWGHDIMSVVFDPHQYSSMSQLGDPNLIRWPASNDLIWLQCLQVAASVISGTTTDLVNGADSYYDCSIDAPDWATPNNFTVRIGNFNFHKVRQ